MYWYICWFITSLFPCIQNFGCATNFWTSYLCTGANSTYSYLYILIFRIQHILNIKRHQYWLWNFPHVNYANCYIYGQQGIKATLTTRPCCLVQSKAAMRVCTRPSNWKSSPVSWLGPKQKQQSCLFPKLFKELKILFWSWKFENVGSFLEFTVCIRSCSLFLSMFCWIC